MGRKCCAPGCRSNYDKESTYITTFQFPKDAEKKNLWLQKINRANFQPSSTAVVCIKHFEERFIVREDRMKRRDGTELVVSRQRLTLTLDAYPSIFENFSSYRKRTLPPKQKNSEERFKKLEQKYEQDFPQCIKKEDVSDQEMKDIKLELRAPSPEVPENPEGEPSEEVTVELSGKETSMPETPEPEEVATILPRIKKSTVGTNTEISIGRNMEEKKKFSARIVGRRIVDISYFFRKLKEFYKHGRKLGCDFSDIIIEKEQKSGLSSAFFFKCGHCKFAQSIWADDPVNRDINSDAVAALISIGCGYYSMVKLFKKLELPRLKRSFFPKRDNRLSKEIAKNAPSTETSALGEIPATCDNNATTNDTLASGEMVTCDDKVEAPVDQVIQINDIIKIEPEDGYEEAPLDKRMDVDEQTVKSPNEMDGTSTVNEKNVTLKKDHHTSGGISEVIRKPLDQVVVNVKPPNNTMSEKPLIGSYHTDTLTMPELNIVNVNSSTQLPMSSASVQQTTVLAVDPSTIASPSGVHISENVATPVTASLAMAPAECFTMPRILALRCNFCDVLFWEPGCLQRHEYKCCRRTNIPTRTTTRVSDTPSQQCLDLASRWSSASTKTHSPSQNFKPVQRENITVPQKVEKVSAESLKHTDQRLSVTNVKSRGLSRDHKASKLEKCSGEANGQAAIKRHSTSQAAALATSRKKMALIELKSTLEGDKFVVAPNNQIEEENQETR